MYADEIKLLLFEDRTKEDGDAAARERETLLHCVHGKQAELDLRLSEERYSGLIQSMDSVIAIINDHGRCLYMNDVAAAVFDEPAGTLMGKTVARLDARSRVRTHPQGWLDLSGASECDRDL